MVTRGRRRRAIGASGLIAASLFLPASAQAQCGEPLPAGQVQQAAARDVTPDDLVRLRDIGPSAVMFLYSSPFGISPDGKRVAFQIRRADPESNSYCLAMVVMELDSARSPVVVDRGGALIRVRFPRGALAGYPSGEPRLITPAWSNDGSRIAFLKLVDGRDQVWIANADGTGSRQVTSAEVDVEDFAWAADGKAIVYRIRPAIEAARRAIEREGLSGFVYGDRWAPVASNRPWPGEPIPSQFEVASLDGKARDATEAERRRIEQPEGIARPDGASWIAASGRALAWVAPSDSARTYSEGKLRVRWQSGAAANCGAAACRGDFMGLWWSTAKDTLWFLRREGWGKSELALYNWTPAKPAPVRIFATRDRLLGCQRARERLICALEQSTRPRRIVSIDPSKGAMHEVFDPNPEFRTLRLGRVERLQWRNDRGIEIYGDLVLPPGPPPARRLPLVIVQYETRGFLRGGTGDEFPIFALAAQGFAVLSIERPRNVSSLTPAADAGERIRLDRGDWADRRSVLSAFATGIALLEKRGIADPARVGITGLSDGSASAQFALVNSSLFAAASLSACCEDPNTLLPLLGLRGAGNLRKYLYPAYTDVDPKFWSVYSLARNARRLDVPLLLQSADDEYLMSLETFTAFKEAGKPVELIVFPGEHHTKWQPSHRFAIYRRNIAWFSFWLAGEATKYATPAEIRRWASMRLLQRRPLSSR